MPASGHVAVVAPCLKPSLGAVLEELFEARLLQRPVEVVGQVEILEGELVAPGTELGSSECRLLPHGMLFESLVGDPRGHNDPVTNMAGQAIDSAGQPLGLVLIRLVKPWRFGCGQPVGGNSWRVTIQAVLLSPAAGFQTLDLSLIHI